MARCPVPGAVKTRLAAHFGAAAACDLYRAFLADIAQRFDIPAWQLVWAVHPAAGEFRSAVAGDAVCIDQRGTNLGERMRNCFSDLFAAGARQVVMLGADAPHLPPATVGDAFAALRECDVVVVPVFDGGYCMIGLRAAHDLFSMIEMGTRDVWEKTRDRVATLGLKVHVFATTFDIDEIDDVRALAELIRGGALDLPRTARGLAGLGLL